MILHCYCKCEKAFAAFLAAFIKADDLFIHCHITYMASKPVSFLRKFAKIRLEIRFVESVVAIYGVSLPVCRILRMHTNCFIAGFIENIYNAEGVLIVEIEVIRNCAAGKERHRHTCQKLDLRVCCVSAVHRSDRVSLDDI